MLTKEDRKLIRDFGKRIEADVAKMPPMTAEDQKRMEAEMAADEAGWQEIRDNRTKLGLLIINSDSFRDRPDDERAKLAIAYEYCNMLSVDGPIYLDVDFIRRAASISGSCFKAEFRSVPDPVWFVAIEAGTVTFSAQGDPDHPQMVFAAINLARAIVEDKEFIEKFLSV
jgi:hypothetical protein